MFRHVFSIVSISILLTAFNMESNSSFLTVFIPIFLAVAGFQVANMIPKNKYLLLRRILQSLFITLLIIALSLDNYTRLSGYNSLKSFLLIICWLGFVIIYTIYYFIFYKNLSIKQFILMLFVFAILIVGIASGINYAGSLKNKCDYYTDNITKLFTDKYEQDVTGKVCDSSDKRSFVQIKDGLAHGKAEIYSPNGTLQLKASYKNGKLDGTSKLYYVSGALRVEMNFQNNIQEGIKKTYYESGALKTEENYKNGKLEGIVKGYYESGTLEIEMNLQNGKLEGISKSYYERGALKTEENYKNGKLEGQSKSYNTYGMLWATITYKNNKAVSGICANGKKWNNAELSNWENGLEVSCD